MSADTLAILVAIGAMSSALGSVYYTYRLWTAQHELRGRYSEALALLVVTARAVPPVADRELRDAIEQYFTKHQIRIEMLVERGDLVPPQP